MREAELPLVPNFTESRLLHISCLTELVQGLPQSPQNLQEGHLLNTTESKACLCDTPAWGHAVGLCRQDDCMFTHSSPFSILDVHKSYL